MYVADDRSRRGYASVGSDIYVCHPCVRPCCSPVEKARYLILTQKADDPPALAHPRAIGEKKDMSATNRNLTAAVENYFSDLARTRASGGATGELSYHTPLANLLGAVGGALKPKAFCVPELADQGDGRPDFGLYAARQIQKSKPREGQTPERGVVEVKSAEDDAWLTAEGEQVSRYWNRYRLVLVTNMHDFLLLGERAGEQVKLESFRLADNAEDFERRLNTPRAFARKVGAGLAEYLTRALSHQAAIAEPKDLAWLLASYARDGLSRVERIDLRGDALAALRGALEEGLGVRFEGERGLSFFHSTLVQTLFYGVFSAWVLWARQTPQPTAKFNWHEAVWHLRAPVLRSLFQQISDPGRLRSLKLVEVLDWTSAALDRVDREAFFARFNEGDAVPYFYEPFLEAFDPALRKQLGVWYTPNEVVRYMVARVDKALKDDLSIADGLAAENVYVLDPCCGTGAYLAEVLRRVAQNLVGQGVGALAGARVKEAALNRVFGFEIMPAPFVVAHLQVGLALDGLGAPLDDNERAGVFLTNALTGWEPHTTKPLPFPELEEERDRAERVKQETPVLVILGNPPYNGYAGMAVDEERALSDAYRTTNRVRKPEGHGLNDLYVRFFRMAERRIAENTGRGVVCFISNYSWLDALSFPGMRERYLEAFDAIRIDCLNGDKYKTGKVTPDGSPDPSIFSSPGDPVGIQVGTAIATLVRKADHTPAREVAFRHLWGQAKREDLLESAEAEPETLYESVEPVLPLGLPFKPTKVSESWFDWLALPKLFPTAFPGVKTSRDSFLVDTDLERLKVRMGDYFNPDLTHDEMARRYPAAMRNLYGFDSRKVRDLQLSQGGPNESGFIRLAYRPFDIRWLYWEAERGLLDAPRVIYRPHVLDKNMCLVLQKAARPDLSAPLLIKEMGDLNQMNSGVYCVPAYLRTDDLDAASTGTRPNLSEAAQSYLKRVGTSVEDLFHHTLATLYSLDYQRENADALRAEGPRIPLPGWQGGGAKDAAKILARSAEQGRKLARLLDTDAPVPGVTLAPLQAEMAAIAVPATPGGGQMMSDDFAVTAGWGHYGAGDAVMPGGGRAVERAYTEEERAALGDAASTLGPTAFDIYLNERALWRCVPAAVWNYKLGGYQVLKKWLSYRERNILGRPLKPEEVQHFTDTARRIAGILMLTKGAHP